MKLVKIVGLGELRREVRDYCRRVYGEDWETCIFYKRIMVRKNNRVYIYSP